MNIAIDADKSLIGGNVAKGYIVVDVPKSCFRCQYCHLEDGTKHPYGLTCRITRRRIYPKGYDIDEKRHDSCPIKEMPERIEPDEDDFEQETYADGRNELIDEMFGGF